MKLPVLTIVVPCYNEQETLPHTAPLFKSELALLCDKNKISPDSRILFVNDGSTDATWSVITSLCDEDKVFEGVSLSCNRGHQNALYAGIMEAKDRSDIIITADCDGQDDIGAMEAMVDRYANGADIVYGVRSSRKKDSPAKRGSARLFYRFMRALGANTVYDHADYRLITSHVAPALSEFKEVNLYLRGIVPLVGFESAIVEYERKERCQGKSHYSPGKMLSLALDAVTGFSVRPLRIISAIGMLVSFMSFIGIIWIFVRFFGGNTVLGWASTLCIMCFVSGVQLISIGVHGEYIGRIYMEVKGRPRYIIAKRTYGDKKECE